MSILTPVLKSPFTDLGGAILSNQWGDSACGKLEMKALECFEAYGVDKGLQKCDTLIKDFTECTTQNKQNHRIAAMRMERHKQHLRGERTSEDKYSKNPPPSDSI